MDKATEGIVIEIRGELALIKPLADVLCSCSCHDEEMGINIIEAKNQVNAAVGDKVVFQVPEQGMLTAAFIVFMLPLILVTIGAIAGYNTAGLLGINSSLAAVAGASLFFLISIIIIRIHDRSASKNPDLIPVITGITSKDYLCQEPDGGYRG